MAKEESNEADDKFEKMDEESLSFLEQVRKGKSRNFVLSMKGNKVRSMIVKKKPVKEKDRKAAKGEGYQPVYGIVTGMGATISFAVARSDGFDEKAADRKTEKLKKFLSEQTGKVFKPTFELVDTPPPIPFDDEDQNDPLIAKFLKMEPVIMKACDAHPDRIPEIQQRVNDIRSLLQDEETRQQADPKMNEFVAYLKDLLAGGAAPASASSEEAPATPPPPQVASGDAATATKLAEALKRLKPMADKIVAADETKKGELFATMAQIAGEIKGGQFAEATQNVKDFATQLKSLAAQQAEAPASSANDLEARFADRRAELEPRLHEAQRADREKATKLGAVWDYALGQAEGGSYDKALQAFDRLAAAIDGVLSALTSSSESRAESNEAEEAAAVKETMSVMKLGKARLEWRDTLKQARVEMERLKSALGRAYADQPQVRGEVAAGLKKLDNVFNKLNGSLFHELDAVLNEGDAKQRAALKNQAKSTMTEFATYARNDSIMKALDGNEILRDTQIAGPIIDKLDEIAAALGSG